MATLIDYNQCQLCNSYIYKKYFNNHIRECTQPLRQGVKDLQATASDVVTSSSGVCINGTEYAGLNTLLAYEKCAAALTVVWKCWEKLDEARVFSK